MKKDINPKGRPTKNIIQPINGTPERVAKSIMQSPPKKQWDYLNKKPKP